ncbi:TPA: helix-turn-helix transcriptional regulator [Candidatus Galligastranaerophilus faecipullorum]|nr:helix-turn-helix transcriptional regulator [Candidatus Galligastranaerophilus faecipullorum]
MIRHIKFKKKFYVNFQRKIIVNIKKEIGEKIKRIRKKRKLTQEQLAEMIEISPRNLSGIEVGANFVKAETLEKILKALDITSEELFSNDHLQDSKILIKYINNSVKNFEQDREKLELIYTIVRFLNKGQA